MNSLPATTHAMPPADHEVLDQLVNVTLPSSQKRRMDALSTRLEEHRTMLGRAWFWQLNTHESNTIRKLKESLQTIFEIAVSGQKVKPADFLPYVEGIIALKMTYDEKNTRAEKWLNRKMRHIFGNPYVSKATYAATIVGVTVSAIAFGWSVYYEHGPEFITFLAIGIIFGVVGGAGGLSTNGLQNYYKAIKVTDQDTRIQAAFRSFTSCYLNHDYDGCSDVLDKLPVEDSLLITNENVLRYIIDYKKGTSALGDSAQMEFSAKGIPSHRQPGSQKSFSARGHELHDSALEIEDEVEVDMREIGEADPFSFTDLAEVLHSFMEKRRHQVEGLSDSQVPDVSVQNEETEDQELEADGDRGSSSADSHVIDILPEGQVDGDGSTRVLAGSLEDGIDEEEHRDQEDVV